MAKKAQIATVRSNSQSGMLTEVYHYFLVINWFQFFVYYILFFILFNLTFGIIYWYLPNSLSGTDQSFWHSFVFSVQTFTTVGYGLFAPASTMGQLIAVFESGISFILTAVLTGLMFAKFSRPVSQIVFSNNILISQFDGHKTLMFRLANLRSNKISEASIGAVVLKALTTKEGEKLRKQFDLKLIRQKSLFFSLTWTIMHIIDEESPLYGYDQEKLASEGIEVAASIMGYDSTFMQTITASHHYKFDAFKFDRYFVDLFTRDEKNNLWIDFSKIHRLKDDNS